MAKVRLNTDTWVTVEGGGLSVDLLLRRMTDLKQIELAEILASKREHVIERESKVKGEKQSERFITAEPGRLVRAQRFMLDNVVRGWRHMEDEKGKPLEFTIDNLDAVMGAYPEWASALGPVVREYANLKDDDEDDDDDDGTEDRTPDPQDPSEPAPQS